MDDLGVNPTISLKLPNRRHAPCLCIYVNKHAEAVDDVGRRESTGYSWWRLSHYL